MFFTKASIVLLYQRLFVPGLVERIAIWWVIWFVFWWNLLYVVAIIIAAAIEGVNNKDKDVKNGEEGVYQAAVVLFTTIINVVSDLMIFGIPVFVVWGLHMSKERKIRLLAVFAMGAL